MDIDVKLKVDIDEQFVSKKKRISEIYLLSLYIYIYQCF